MLLFETMMQRPEERAAIAARFAEGLAIEGGDAGPSIIKELAAILIERKILLSELEELNEERATKQPPALDFIGVEVEGEEPQKPTPQELVKWEADTAAEYEATARRIKDKIKLLNSFFVSICVNLYDYGLYLSGGEISNLTRLGMPERSRHALRLIKRGKISVLPESEKVSDDTAAALYEKLTRSGLISGSYSDFCAVMGECKAPPTKTPKTALKWTGTLAQFAYFVWRYTCLTQNDGAGYIIREKAFCIAFGYDDTQRLNVIRPYLSDIRNGKEVKGGDDIAAIFDNLP